MAAQHDGLGQDISRPAPSPPPGEPEISEVVRGEPVGDPEDPWIRSARRPNRVIRHNPRNPFQKSISLGLTRLTASIRWRPETDFGRLSALRLCLLEIRGRGSEGSDNGSCGVPRLHL